MACLKAALLLYFAFAGAALVGGQEDEQKVPMYCGAKNCYDILSLTDKATLADIKKVYKKLSFEWHPDKNTKPGAKDRFAEIAQAYGILSDEEQRRDYDYALKHPEKRAYNQARYYYRQYYRKTVQINPFLVISVFLLGFSALQYFSMKYMYEQAVRTAKASPKYKMALNALKQAKLDELDRKSSANGKGKSKKALKDIEVDESVLLEKIQVYGGSAKPNVMDLLVVRLVCSPYHLVKGLAWQYNFYTKYTLGKQPYSDEDKALLTRRVIGMSEEQWDGLESKKQNELLSKELWDEDNAKNWREAGKKVD